MKKIDLSFINNFFARLNAKSIVRPQRDWEILITVLLVLILSSIAFDLSLYAKITSGEMYVTVNKQDLNVESLNASGLKSVVDDFDLRKENIAGLKADNLVDPSL